MTAYDMRISDWSSDVCSSDLIAAGDKTDTLQQVHRNRVGVDQIVARRGCHMALAVDEHQRAGRAKTAKIEDIEPGGADEAGRVALAEGRAQRRKIVERVAERNVTRIGQFADAPQIGRAAWRERECQYS